MAFPRRLSALARAEIELGIGLVLLITAVWLFVGIGQLVDAGATQTLDEAIVRALRDPHDPTLVRGGPVVQEIARDLTALGSVTVLASVVLVVLAFLVIERLHRPFVLVALAAIGGTAWTFFLKEVYGRPRPSVVGEVVTSTSSFPSGHSAISAVVYLTLAVLLARLLRRRALRAYVIGVAGLITALVGLSRIALGVHYPSDVLAGWTLGGAWALCCWWGMAVLQRLGKVETAGQARDVVDDLARADAARDAAGEASQPPAE